MDALFKNLQLFTFQPHNGSTSVCCENTSNQIETKWRFKELKCKLKCELETRSEMALQIDVEIERLLSAMLTDSMVTAVMSLQQISWDIQAAKLSCKSRRHSPEETEERVQIFRKQVYQSCTCDHLGIIRSIALKPSHNQNYKMLLMGDCRCGIRY